MLDTIIMRIFFSGIGGHGLGPLALIAKQAGYDVVGSDKSDSEFIGTLRQAGIDVYIGQTTEHITEVHTAQAIDWLVYSSAVPRENPRHPELIFAQEHAIKHTKRDELLNQILKEKGQKLLAIAGTHGKTTTTAMVVWLFKQLELPVSYSVGAEIDFGPSGHFDPESEYFVYEADEFDRNFLAYHPWLSVITGLSWDHHEIFPSQDDYNDAFRQFASQSQNLVVWQEDAKLLKSPGKNVICSKESSEIEYIKLAGQFNRQDAWQAIQAVHMATGAPLDKLIDRIGNFSGLAQRMEQLAPNLYTNYAHTPEKIRGCLLTARDLAKPGQKIVAIYEPLTNRRQYFIRQDYKDCFNGADHIYWLPTYLAREDPGQKVLQPAELIAYLSNPETAEPAKPDDNLADAIKRHLASGDMVVAIGAAGPRSLDYWLRDIITQR